jgi:hypothetical protein
MKYPATWGPIVAALPDDIDEYVWCDQRGKDLRKPWRDRQQTNFTLKKVKGPSGATAIAPDDGD